MKKKKVITIIVAVILVLGIIGSFGESDESSSIETNTENSSQETVTETNTNKSSEPTTATEALESNSQNKASNQSTQESAGNSQSENTVNNISNENTPEMFVNDVKNLAQNNISKGESIIDVKLEDNDLCVYIDISNADTSVLTLELLAETRTSSITDDILTLQNYDDLWETITIDFGNVGKIKNSKDRIETNAYGRYFPLENFILE